jgi:cytochrome c553
MLFVESQKLYQSAGNHRKWVSILVGFYQFDLRGVFSDNRASHNRNLSAHPYPLSFPTKVMQHSISTIRKICASSAVVTKLCSLALLSMLPLFMGLRANASDFIEDDSGTPDFVRDVRPIFEVHCYGCHGAEKQKSGYRLDAKSIALAGGDVYGEAIVGGNASESVLIQLVSSADAGERMPPDGPPLTAEQIGVLKKWIDAGANWPEGIDSAVIEDKRDHWALKPRKDVPLPSIKNLQWPRDGIDYFIEEKLTLAGLQVNEEADRITWLRRVTLDLLGLPPTLPELESFIADARPDAYERVVDRLLSSPRYGERWGQHWLDVVRYADTHGFEVNTERPNAWPYRDYVISAMNQDTAYDQFIREQIAGDRLNADAATGFLITASVLLPGQIGQDEPSKRLARQDSLDEIVVNIGQTFLGLSIGCARCHDHKFDAISQKDYYSMQAFVAGVEYEERELQTADAKEARRRAEEAKSQLAVLRKELDLHGPIAFQRIVRPGINAERNTDRIVPHRSKKLRFTILKTNNLEPCIDELEIINASGENVAIASRGTKVTSSGDNVAPDRHELRFINDGVYGNSRSWMSNEMGKGWVELEFPQVEDVRYIIWGRDRERVYKDRLAIEYRIEVADENGQWHYVADHSDRATYNPDSRPNDPESLKFASQSGDPKSLEVKQKIDALEVVIAKDTQGQLAFAGKFRKPDTIRLLSRGDPEQPKGLVAPAVLEALDSLVLSEDSAENERRVTLANWIAKKENPLTARVIVNRVWQSHFGIGIVETSNDFGRNGSVPTHPELLDWLANEFVSSGWSIKQLHRRIVLSATYRQSSASNKLGADADADCRLLWRFPPRRMDAEMMRDSLLAMCGRLHHQMGGSGFDLFDKRGGLSGFEPIEVTSQSNSRRMVYAHKVRREREAVFGAFDCPDAGQSTPRRRESTTPLQALNLLNSRFAIEHSSMLAEQIEQKSELTVAQKINHVFLVVLGRAASEEEQNELLPMVAQEGLMPLCRALFNSNEFLLIP